MVTSGFDVCHMRMFWLHLQFQDPHELTTFFCSFEAWMIQSTISLFHIFFDSLLTGLIEHLSFIGNALMSTALTLMINLTTHCMEKCQRLLAGTLKVTTLLNQQKQLHRALSQTQNHLTNLSLDQGVTLVMSSAVTHPTGREISKLIISSSTKESLAVLGTKAV